MLNRACCFTDCYTSNERERKPEENNNEKQQLSQNLQIRATDGNRCRSRWFVPAPVGSPDRVPSDEEVLRFEPPCGGGEPEHGYTWPNAAKLPRTLIDSEQPKGIS